MRIFRTLNGMASGSVAAFFVVLNLAGCDTDFGQVEEEPLVAGQGFSSMPLGTEFMSVIQKYGVEDTSIVGSDEGLSISLDYNSRELTLHFSGRGQCATALRSATMRKLYIAISDSPEAVLEYLPSCNRDLVLDRIDLQKRSSNNFLGALQLADGTQVHWGDRSGPLVQAWQQTRGKKPPLGQKSLRDEGASFGFNRPLKGPLDLQVDPTDGVDQPEVVLLSVFRQPP